MKFMHITKPVDNERGASAVEYGLLVAAIAAIIVAIVFVIGTTTNTFFTDTNECLNDGVAADC